MKAIEDIQYQVFPQDLLVEQDIRDTAKFDWPSRLRVGLEPGEAPAGIYCRVKPIEEVGRWECRRAVPVETINEGIPAALWENFGASIPAFGGWWKYGGKTGNIVLQRGYEYTGLLRRVLEHAREIQPRLARIESPGWPAGLSGIHWAVLPDEQDYWPRLSRGITNSNFYDGTQWQQSESHHETKAWKIRQGEAFEQAFEEEHAQWFDLADGRTFPYEKIFREGGFDWTISKRHIVGKSEDPESRFSIRYPYNENVLEVIRLVENPDFDSIYRNLRDRVTT